MAGDLEGVQVELRALSVSASTISSLSRIGALLALLVVPAASAHADPEALWRIVHDQCVPNQINRHNPSPCALVDLAGGYVVLKDRVGATQFLVLPTARIAGIESAALLSPRVPDYMQDAWSARRFVMNRFRCSRRARW